MLSVLAKRKRRTLEGLLILWCTWLQKIVHCGRNQLQCINVSWMKWGNI